MDATLIETAIEQTLAARPGSAFPERLVIGFSGGLDSTVLLHLARQWQQQHPAVPLLALHVNHQLQPHADSWQQQCETLCRQWQIPFIGETVQVDRSSASLEQSARDARYSAFQRHTRPDDLLLLAHHRDDQVETLLQRLLRGSGPLGLGGMGLVSRQNGLTIARPLLEFDRAALEQYARRQNLSWIDDPSNSDSQFERNFLRHDALPLLRTRWPQLNQTLARSARLSRESAALLDELAQLDLGEPVADGGLPVSQLQRLTEPRARNLIRYWLRQQGASLPSEVQLQRVLDEMIPAPVDARPEILWGGQALRRYREVLYCVPLLPPAPQQPLPVTLDTLAALTAFAPTLHITQTPSAHDLAIPGRLTSRSGQGTAFSRVALQTGPLTLRFRQGGEQVKPAGRHTRSLKQWLQDYRVPPWWRDHWPILYINEEIAGLPGLFAGAGFAPQSPQDGLWLDWQPPMLTAAALSQTA